METLLSDSLAPQKTIDITEANKHRENEYDKEQPTTPTDVQDVAKLLNQSGPSIASTMTKPRLQAPQSLS